MPHLHSADTTEAATARPQGRLWPWVSAAARLGLAAVWIISGLSKIGDPLATRQSVAAYELFSPGIVNIIGTAIAPVEIALGVLVLLGVFLRPVGIVSGVIFLAFIGGIASAWARGLTIDCGCFGTGGYNADVTWWTYTSEILRDLLFVAMAAIVAWRPFRRFALYP
ncbi:DoxX family protein [Corynebacterium sp. 13CS0277]|uniref:MauE/DoxX family redox-associated membrane protein n=1 Tax=Corynebacterium sp. 13CS0277 TaxID=2071994 RepID=UPI000D048266|nr:MauE/DoxX family redox-associated membrane protein [Corynebacterium sp. 13CS0277]PRQ10332.1 DoxX family protein [Corynebacterium sp. 13CS0277]